MTEWTRTYIRVKGNWHYLYRAVDQLPRMAGRQKINRLGGGIFRSIGPRMNIDHGASLSRS
jgi:hypothetical protein